MNKEEILHELEKVVHPEFEKDIVALGMIGNIATEENKITLQLLFKKQRDPLANALKKACLQVLSQKYPQAKIDIEESFNQQASEPQKPSQKDFALSKIKHIIGIASGKGGVGKSTVSANLAVALARKGFKVGLVDADIYGPSIPKMFGIEDAKPYMVTADGYEMIEPAEQYGVKILSIGFFVNPEDALIWRAPMATSALKQLVGQGNWGELDFLLIDLPPGTGDIHLTMIQDLNLTGAIIVTTPQPVALADAIKGINMFRQEKINVHIIGLVENMAWFTPEELPQNRYYIFGKDGGKQLAEKENIPLLAQIPIVQSIREDGDKGKPAILSNSMQTQALETLAENFVKKMQ